MNQFSIKCLRSFTEFQSVRCDWEKFTERYFPENYNRTHSWLSAWWTTYHYDQQALVYIQRRQGNDEIVAVAPLFIRRENFGGFPALSLQFLGVGIGTDDFLVSEDSENFVDNVIHDLLDCRKWDLAIFRRIGAITSLETITAAALKSGCAMESVGGDDYLINLPENYESYFKGLSKKFRQNLRTAANRMTKAGKVSTRILDPSRDSHLVIGVGMLIAQTSWQFKEGKSHFNSAGSGSFYHNLAGLDLVEGLEFNVLYLDELPVSYLLGCHRGEKYHVIDIAFHSEYKFYSAGHVLYTKVIERLINEKTVRQIDLEGAGEYKDDYANTRRTAYSLTLFNKTLYVSLIRRIRESSVYKYIKKKIRKT